LPEEWYSSASCFLIFAIGFLREPKIRKRSENWFWEC
jgi:hypothetical protein